MDCIRVRGARTHNLRNISLDIPRNRLVVFTGVSGSGKSSLAFDTVYAESQRRYAESVSAYARQFMDVMERPDVDSIEGLSPSIAIGQRAGSGGSRSTVGTLTEVSDYARLLFARAGTPYCPEHGVPLKKSGIHDMVDAALELPEGTRIHILAPLAPCPPAELAKTAVEMSRRGFVRLRINGEVCPVDDLPDVSGEAVINVDVVVDRLRTSDLQRTRLADSFEAAARLSGGRARLLAAGEERPLDFSLNYGCPCCGRTFGELSAALFSFNNALGACPECQGAGDVERFDERIVVRDPQAGIAAGAVCGYSQASRASFRILADLAHTFGFSLEAPWKDLPENIRTLVLYGAAAAGLADRSSFAGVIPLLEDKWKRARTEATRTGLKMMRSVGPCPACGGARFRREVQDVCLGRGDGRINIVEFNRIQLSGLATRLAALDLDERERAVAAGPLEEIRRRIGYLVDAGLGYLTLGRLASTLSGGELQRIRLAGQIGSALTGVTYVLDEPTVGLHQSDTEKLVATMKKLVCAGNTVLVVEHDPEVMRAADWLVDMGPGAGEHGGTVLAAGTPQQVMGDPKSATGAYLAGRLRVDVPGTQAAMPGEQVLRVVGARGRNLQDLTCRFPVGALTAVTGVSGSGKSTLVMETLSAAMRRTLHHAKERGQPCSCIEGLEFFDKVVEIDQAPIGRTPRSNPATYIGLFAQLREVFAQTPAARERGYDAGRFSFNTPGGRCEACEGDGVVKIEMGFLPPVYVTCSTCLGRRYNRETLEVRYCGRSIADVLEMTVNEAIGFFSAWPAITRKLETLSEVGLGYIRLGQGATTFSGGEAQRIKLAAELSRRDTGRTLYILDEPTTGLHFSDVAALLAVLRKLTGLGNTVIVIEHNLDVIRLADWVVDIGPLGGSEGGRLVVEGTPADIARCPESITGRYLAGILAGEAPR